MERSFNFDEYKAALGTLPYEIISLLALRNSWRALSVSAIEFQYIDNEEDIIGLINALLFSSVYTPDIYSSVHKEFISKVEKIYDNARVLNTIDLVETAVFSVYNTISIFTEESKSIVELAACSAEACFAAAKLATIPLFLLKVDVYSREISDELIELIYFDLQNAQKNKLSINSPIFNTQTQIVAEDLLRILIEFNSSIKFYIPFIQRRFKGDDFSFEDKRLQKAFSDLSEEKINQNPLSVFQFIQDHYNGSLSEKVNIVRVIFIGPGGVGKTSLIKALNGLEIDEGKEKPTPGISTSFWSWGKDCNIEIRIWDFAGQVTTHSMHKFFLRERCLYVLLLTTRDDQELESQAEYWLEHIRLYGNDSPVIVVANKIDGDSVNVNFNEHDLSIKYPFIISFKKIAATKAKSQIQIEGTSYSELFNNFRNLLKDSIKTVSAKYKNELSSEENKVKESLFKLKNQSFIDTKTFVNLCLSNNVPRNRIDTLKEFFNNLGILVYFPDLNDDSLLDPRWLTYGVYAILRHSEKMDRKGFISKSEIRNFLIRGVETDNGFILEYSVEKINTLIIECILKFRLGYSIIRNGIDYLVMPSVLDKVPPVHHFDKNKHAIHFIFDFEVFVPPYVFHAYISKLSDKIINDFVWQNGLILEDETKAIRALIEKFSTRKIDIFINIEIESQRRSACSFLFSLIEQFIEIINTSKGTEKLYFQKWVEIPEAYYWTENVNRLYASRIISYQVLLDAYHSNEVSCRTEYGKININKFFGDFPMAKEPKNKQTVNNTYIIAGNQYNAAHDQYVAKNNISIKKAETITQLIPLLNEFIERMSVNKEMRKEIYEIRSFLEELSKFPEELNKEEVESVTEKFRDKSFWQKISSLTSVPADLITIGDKIIPLLLILLNHL